MRLKALLIALSIAILPAASVAQSDSRTDDAARRASIEAGLVGTWISFRDGAVDKIAGYAPDGSLFSGGRLARFRVTGVDPHKPIDELIAGVDESVQTMAALLDTTSLRGLDLRLAEGLQNLATATKAMAEDARAAGAEELPSVAMRHVVEYADGRTRGESLLFRLAGDRLYEYTDDGYVLYERVTSLSGDRLATWREFGERGYASAKEREYRRLREACVLRERGDFPVESCRAWRDRMASFGVELQPEFVLERYRDFPFPEADEHAFWKEIAGGNGERMTVAYPLLDYCYSGMDGIAGTRAFNARLAARGFRNTLWRLSFVTDIPLERPRNWSDEQYRQVEDLSRWMLGPGYEMVTLRADGVLVYGQLASKQNRWHLDGDVLVMAFHDGAFTLRFPVVENQPRLGTTNLKLAPTASLVLVRGDYELLMFDGGFFQTAYPGQELIDAWSTQRCVDGDFVADVEPEAPIQRDATPTDDAAAATDSSPGGTGATPWMDPPVDYPRYWHARLELANGGRHPNAEAQAQMERGSYYHLGDASKVGIHAEVDGLYDYTQNATWAETDGVLTLNLATLIFAFELSGANEPVEAVESTIGQYRMILTPAHVHVRDR